MAEKETIVGTVDVEEYTIANGCTLKLGGWRGSEEAGAIDIRLVADGQELTPDRQEYYPRPDVFAVCTTLNQTDPNCAFKFQYFHLKDLLKKYGSFQVQAVRGNEIKVLWERTAKEVEKEYIKRSIKYEFDYLKARRDGFAAQGWLVDGLNRYEIAVVDGSGHPVPYELEWVPRLDIVEEMELGDTRKNCGFDLKVAKADYPADNIIVLQFKNKAICREERCDLKYLAYKNTRRFRRRELFGRDNWKENKEYIRKFGLAGFREYARDYIEGDPDEYDEWRMLHLPTAKELAAQRKHVFAYQPLISIVIPLYNTPLNYLRELLDSILGQTYAKWELCLADGGTDTSVQEFMKKYQSESRILYTKLEKNLGIAGNTNAAAEMATGEFVMFCDHDDLLETEALYQLVKKLNEEPDLDIIYTDEDLVNADTTYYMSPRHKPDYNPDMLSCINYICHIFMVRRTILDQTGVLRADFDGAQDHDLIMRCCEKTEKVGHIAKVLYHWRAHENSTAGNQDSKQYAIDAARRAIEEHLQRTGQEGEVRYTDIFIMHQVILKAKGNPKVSIIIPSMDHTEDLDLCITSIMEKSTWKNKEIIVVENNSQLPETFTYYEELQKRYPEVRVVTWQGEGGFNYSALNNFGARYATGEYFLLLNNDIEVISPDWIEGMLGYCQREDVGAVGAKLYYPDGTVQHCGVVVGLGGFAGHVETSRRKSDAGYFGRLKTVQDISAVTAACMMVDRSVFEAVGGLSEDFAVAMNDIDFCLKIRALGKRIVLNPCVELTHYESKSRGYEVGSEKQARFRREVEHFRNKWAEVLEKGDPYYNPNLTLMYGDCRLRRKHEHFDILEQIAQENQQ